MIRGALSLIFVVALVACATPGRVRSPYLPTPLAQHTIVVRWPAVDTVATVQVGESMIETGNVVRLPAAVLDQPAQLIAVYREGMSRMSLDIRPSTAVLAAVDGKGGEYFQSPEPVSLAYESTGGNFPNPQTFRGGLHRSKSGTWSVYWFWEGWSEPIISPPLAPQPSVAMKSADLPPKEAPFKRSLVYAGTSQSTLSISYRELLNDMARPAFSQELRYDAAKGAIIGYKGARFEVLEAGNTSIKYRVLAPLE